MTDIIDLDSHRERPGVVWSTATVRCVDCGHIHVAVQEMPEWAAAPMSCDCPKCLGAKCCLVMADQPAKVEQEPVVEWPLRLAVTLDGGWCEVYEGDAELGTEVDTEHGRAIVRRGRKYRVFDLDDGDVENIASEAVYQIGTDLSALPGADSGRVFGQWEESPGLAEGAEGALREALAPWVRRYVTFDLWEVEPEESDV